MTELPRRSRWRTINPSSARRSSAWRTVTRPTRNSPTRSSRAGNRSPGCHSPLEIRRRRTEATLRYVEMPRRFRLRAASGPSADLERFTVLSVNICSVSPETSWPCGVLLSTSRSCLRVSTIPRPTIRGSATLVNLRSFEHAIVNQSISNAVARGQLELPCGDCRFLPKQHFEKRVGLGVKL